MILSRVVVEILEKNRIGGGLAVVVSGTDYKGVKVGFNNVEDKDVLKGHYWEARLEHGHYKTLVFLRRLNDCKANALKESMQ